MTSINLKEVKMLSRSEFIYTAVMPVYNSAVTMRAAIESIMAQEIPANEILIFDDASTDDSFEIAEKFSLNNSQIRTYIGRNSLGAAGARNFLSKIARSPYLVFFDSDDISSPQRTITHAEHFIGGADLSYVSSKKDYQNGYEKLELNLNFCGQIPYKALINTIFFGDKINEGSSFTLPASTLAIRHASFEKLMGFNEEFLRLEDMDLALRASNAGMKFCTSENVLVVRLASNSDSKSPLNEAISQQRLLDEHSSSLGKKAVLTLKLEIVSRRFYFEKRFVRFCLWGILLILVSRNRCHKLHSLLKRLTHDLRK